jgi:hypothetical protein
MSKDVLMIVYKTQLKTISELGPRKDTWLPKFRLLFAGKLIL